MTNASDGFTRLSWVPSIANTAAPTTTELNAGTALESYLPPDGWDPGLSDAQFTTSVVNQTQEFEAQGRSSAKPKVKCFSDCKADTPWTTFAGKPTGFLVARRGYASTLAYASAQKVDIFPVQMGERVQKGTADNEATQFEIGGALTAPFVQSSAIA